MNELKICQSEHLIIRDLVEDDFIPYSEYMFEEVYWKYVAIPEINAENLKGLIQESIRQQSLKPRRNYFLSVEEKRSKQVIGDAMISIVSPENEEAEIGWGVSHQYTGRGYATEIGQALIQYIFEDLKLYRIYARCHPENLASVRIMEKLGMKKEGLLREHIKIRGERWSSFQYSLLATEYNRDDCV